MDVNNDQENSDFHIKREKVNNNQHYNDNNHNNSDQSEEFNDNQEYLDDDLELGGGSSAATDADQNNHQEGKNDDNNMSDNNIVVQQNDIKNESYENNFEDDQPDETNEMSDNHNKVINDDVENIDEEEPMDDQDYDQNESDNLEHGSSNQLEANIWTLPSDKNVCTLEEIRRGQVINKVPPTMCPVLGCGKIINEAKAEPSPGTIASGLRTHVLFVHYAAQHGRKVVKKRKALGWTNKKRNQNSPKKHLNQLLSTRFQPPEQSSSTNTNTNFDNDRNDPLDLKQQQTSDLLANLQKNMAAALNSSAGNSAPGSLLDKKVKQMAANKSLQVLQMSSHQSLMQATGGGGSSGGVKQNSNLLQKQKNPTTTSNTTIQSQPNNNFNSTTSSLFSILAGLTAQQQKNQINQPQQQSSLPRNIKTAHGTNTINITQCPRNTTNNNNSSNNTNRAVNSSLLSLLNEKISGNVGISLQNQLKKSLTDQRGRLSSSTPRHISPSPALTTNSYYSSNNNESNNITSNGSSLLSNFCNTGVGITDDALSYDTSMPLNSFIETIALRTGSNIGLNGVAEVKKFIEKFTTSLICSSQTIADHYLAPYGGDVSQQKPEISPSDVILAYKMMNKSQMQI